MSTSSDAGVDNYRKAIDSYRSVAKWVVSSFGAVAAALVVGLPLTSLGELEDLTLVAAILCVAVVFVAILVVIRSACQVLEPLPPVGRSDLVTDTLFFGPLNAYVKDHQSILGRKDVTTTAELKAKYDGLLAKKRKATADYAKAESPGNKKAFDYAVKVTEQHKERLDHLVTFGGVLHMERLYKKAMKRVYIAIAVSGAVAVCFACLSGSAANADSGEEATASNQAPIHVTVGGPRPLDWPRSCARLYFALDKLAVEQPRVGPLWPKGSLSPWDRKCGLENREDVQRALEFLGRP
jgi:hypothetical protein